MESRAERVGRAVLEFWDEAIGEDGDGDVSGTELVDVVSSAVLASVREEAREYIEADAADITGDEGRCSIPGDADVEHAPGGYWVDARVWVPRCV